MTNDLHLISGHKLENKLKLLPSRIQIKDRDQWSGSGITEWDQGTDSAVDASGKPSSIKTTFIIY